MINKKYLKRSEETASKQNIGLFLHEFYEIEDITEIQFPSETYNYTLFGRSAKFDRVMLGDPIKLNGTSINLTENIIKAVAVALNLNIFYLKNGLSTFATSLWKAANKTGPQLFKGRKEFGLFSKSSG